MHSNNYVSDDYDYMNNKSLNDMWNTIPASLLLSSSNDTDSFFTDSQYQGSYASKYSFLDDYSTPVASDAYETPNVLYFKQEHHNNNAYTLGSTRDNIKIMTTPKACKFVTPKCKNVITPSTTESASLNEVSGCSFDLNSYLVMEDYLYNFFSKDNNDGVNKNTKSEPVKVVYASHMAQAVLGEYLVNEDAKCVSNHCDSSSVPQKGGQNLEHPTTITTHETAKPNLYYDYRSNHPYSCKPCAFYWNKGCINGKNCMFCHLWHLPKRKKPMREQRNLMIITRDDGKIMFFRCKLADEEEKNN